MLDSGVQFEGRDENGTVLVGLPGSKRCSTRTRERLTERGCYYRKKKKTVSPIRENECKGSNFFLSARAGKDTSRGPGSVFTNIYDVGSNDFERKHIFLVSWLG